LWRNSIMEVVYAENFIIIFDGHGVHIIVVR